eukprot:6064222-Prorocentrum_lima.AAC.1
MAFIAEDAEDAIRIVDTVRQKEIEAKRRAISRIIPQIVSWNTEHAPVLSEGYNAIDRMIEIVRERAMR